MPTMSKSDAQEPWRTLYAE